MSCLVEPLLNHIPTQNPAPGNCRHWYVLYTYPRHEKAVDVELLEPLSLQNQSQFRVNIEIQVPRETFLLSTKTFRTHRTL
jgi:hypothetical protein